MNRVGENFREKRVWISKETVNSLIKNLRKTIPLRELARTLGVSSYTVRHDWVVKGNTIPLSIFKKIVKMSNKDFSDFENKIQILEPFWGQKIGGKKDRPFSLPNITTKEFAEFYGIMLGDGCIYSDFSGLCISGDKILDNDYYENHLNNLIFNLFKLKPKIYYEKNDRTIRLKLYSKKICKYLHNLGFPIGKKLKSNPEIPKYILSKPELVSACIRGLVDTDGSITSHPNSKIMMHLSVVSDSLRDSAYNAFNILSIKVGKYNKGITLYGQEKLKEFFKTVGTSNLKNTMKYKKFLKTGKVPRSREIEIFLREEKR